MDPLYSELIKLAGVKTHLLLRVLTPKRDGLNAAVDTIRANSNNTDFMVQQRSGGDNLCDGWWQ